jgi:hydrogenase maturation factor
VTPDPAQCVTCSDTAVDGVVVDVDGETATVAVGDAHERVGIELVGPVEVGDRLLCHAGIALARVDE